MAGVGEKQGQLVFGLDIGTRSIVGTVGYMSGGSFHVVAQRSKEHETRAMLDGQIHDIAKVGESISQIRQQLEEDVNQTLSEVCIAAAGRVLRTVTTYAEQSFETEREITKEDIYALSTMGIEKAYEEFQKGNDTGVKFYCVGYTPMRFYMNGYQISNLEDHKAKNIGVDLIATFLPDDVVDGLYKAVEMAKLRVANLTLEPIAAIQLAIPEKFRMLNLALVDVGAGTSDICITKEGTITAYGMIPIAGDSLTDLIVQHCLVDFETAEHIKRSAGEEEVIEYTDIIGLPQTITAKEILTLLEPSVNNMTKLVADGIMELNGDKPVSAVFVVGGGGMIPGYTESLARQLGIVKERVAIRGKEVMQNICFEQADARKDSMMVTPIGICLSFFEQSNNFVFVEFNGQRIKLYDNGKLTVADAAMQSQFPNQDLFPKRGETLSFTINGKNRIVRGSVGEAAIITVNGENADMYTKVHNGDRIEVLPSTAGENAAMVLGKLTELAEPLHIVVNGNRISLPRKALVNNKQEEEGYEIREGDDIKVQNYYAVSEIAKLVDMPFHGSILVNDAPARQDTRVYEDFIVSLCMDEAQDNTNEAIAEAASNDEKENKQTEADKQQTPVNTPVNKEIIVIVNRQALTLKGKSSYVYVDVFDYIDFDLSKSAGRTIVTTLNGRQAEYMEELHDGDIIEIFWKENN